MRFLDETDRRYGKLTVIRRAGFATYGESDKRFTLWLCQCSCGKTAEIVGQSLRAGRAQSCGCARSTNPATKASNQEATKGRVIKQKLAILMAQQGYSDEAIVKATGYDIRMVKRTHTLARTRLKLSIPYSTARRDPLDA